MGTAQSQIFPPGTPSHMDHIQSLSSSIDVKGPEGWGYSDDPTNFSYLDQDYNVNTKLNYDLQTTHQLGRLADTLRRQRGYGQQFHRTSRRKNWEIPTASVCLRTKPSVS